MEEKGAWGEMEPGALKCEAIGVNRPRVQPGRVALLGGAGPLRAKGAKKNENCRNPGDPDFLEARVS